MPKNETLKDPNEIAKAINEHYYNIGSKMSASIEKPKDKELELPVSNPKSMFINPTNKHKIQQIIDNTKLKNGGIDKINAKTLK